MTLAISSRRRNPTVPIRVVPTSADFLTQYAGGYKSQSHRSDQDSSNLKHNVVFFSDPYMSQSPPYRPGSWRGYRWTTRRVAIPPYRSGQLQGKGKEIKAGEVLVATSRPHCTDQGSSKFVVDPSSTRLRLRRNPTAHIRVVPRTRPAPPCFPFRGNRNPSYRPGQLGVQGGNVRG